MTRAAGGIVLPESVLTSQWFILLATVVAFNTVVYLGLTLAKLIPLPKQFHPSRVRRWLKAGGIEIDEDSAMDDIPVRMLAESADPYENLRRGVAKRDIPQAFALVGGLIILLSMAAFITQVDNRAYGALVELVVGLIFLLISQILGRRDFRARVVMWTWALSCVVLVAVLSLEAVRSQTQTPVAYTLIVLTAFAPLTLAWRPSIIASEIMFGIVLGCFIHSGSNFSSGLDQGRLNLKFGFVLSSRINLSFGPLSDFRLFGIINFNGRGFAILSP